MRNALLIILMGFIITMGWYVSLRVPAEVNRKFEEAASRGAEYEEKGFYIDAISSYNEALAIKSDPEIKRAIVMDYLAMEDYKNFEKQAVEFLKSEPDEEIYAGLIRYYFDSSSKETAGKYLTAAEESFPDSEEIHELRTEYNGLFNLSFTEYTDVTDFTDGHAIATVFTGKTLDDEEGTEVYYLLDSKGKKELKNSFAVIDDVKGVNEDDKAETEEDTTETTEEAKSDGISGEVIITGQFYEDEGIVCLDEDGYNRAIDTDELDYISVEHDGKMLVSSDGKWMYMTDGETGDEYDDATIFMNGIAAVKKDGLWALIDTDEHEITGYIFEEVYMDSFRCCSRGGVVLAKKKGDDGFKLLDAEGEQIGKDTYEEVKGFLAETGVAAVKKNGKWGAIDVEGETVLDFEYDELGSSETNYIPYKDGERWGYIDTEGEVLIEAQFDAAGGITEDGYGMVREGDYWEIITIYSIKGEESLFDM